MSLEIPTPNKFTPSELSTLRTLRDTSPTLPQLLVLMRLFPLTPRIQRNCCIKLANLTYNSTHLKCTASLYGAIDTVVFAIRQHIHNSVVVEWSCFVLWNLGCCPSIPKVIIDAGGVNAILSSIKWHLKKLGVMERSLGALWTVTLDHEGKKEVLENDGIKLVLNVMETYLNDATMQSLCLTVLVNVSISEEVRLLSEEEVKGVLHAMTLHGNNREVVQKGFSVLWNGSFHHDNVVMMRKEGELRKSVTRVLESARDFFSERKDVTRRKKVKIILDKITTLEEE